MIYLGTSRSGITSQSIKIGILQQTWKNINVINRKLPTKNHVSHIYRNLVLDIPDNTFYVKNKWELELNIVTEDGEWEKIRMGCHKGINSNMWKEIDWKMKMRLFKTPLVVSTFIDNPVAMNPLGAEWNDWQPLTYILGLPKDVFPLAGSKG